MPETVNSPKRQKFCELCGSEFVNSFQQAELLSEHDQTGLCYGVAYEWIRRYLAGTRLPSPKFLTDDEKRRIRFAYALANLQRNVVVARKVPTGLSAQIPGTTAHPDMAHRGNAPGDWGATVDAIADTFKVKVDRSEDGYAAPLAKSDGFVMIHRCTGDFGLTLDHTLRTDELEFYLGREPFGTIKNYVDPFFTEILRAMEGIKSAFTSKGLPSPFKNRPLYVLVGLRNPGVSAHAIALSIDIDAMVFRVFDPNIGEFRFEGFSRFRTALSVLLCTFYGRRNYSQFETEWFDINIGEKMSDSYVESVLI